MGGAPWVVESLTDLVGRRVSDLDRAGFDVNVVGDLETVSLPRSTQETIGKVLHESLSNVERHAAPASPVTVMLDVTDDAVGVAVMSRLRDGGSAPGSRLGLVGMRERVEGVGGTFWAEPIAHTWLVEVQIPRRHGLVKEADSA